MRLSNRTGHIAETASFGAGVDTKKPPDLKSGASHFAAVKRARRPCGAVRSQPVQAWYLSHHTGLPVAMAMLRRHAQSP